MFTDAQRLRRYRVSRMQRGIEYILLASLFFYFLIAFFGRYHPALVLVPSLLFLLMNVQLTLQREDRRSRPASRRARLITEVLESFLFLGLILLFSSPAISQSLLGLSVEDHYGLFAGILCGIFLGGLIGEVWFQIRRLPELDPERQVYYMDILKRTIILPYFSTRR